MNTIEAHIDSATIQAIAQLIVERFDPEQIILLAAMLAERLERTVMWICWSCFVQTQDGHSMAIRFVGRLPSISSCPLMWLSALQKSSPSSAMTRIP